MLRHLISLITYFPFRLNKSTYYCGGGRANFVIFYQTGLRSAVGGGRGEGLELKYSIIQVHLYHSRDLLSISRVQGCSDSMIRLGRKNLVSGSSSPYQESKGAVTPSLDLEGKTGFRNFLSWTVTISLSLIT